MVLVDKSDKEKFPSTSIPIHHDRDQHRRWSHGRPATSRAARGAPAALFLFRGAAGKVSDNRDAVGEAKGGGLPCARAKGGGRPFPPRIGVGGGELQAGGVVGPAGCRAGGVRAEAGGGVGEGGASTNASSSSDPTWMLRSKANDAGRSRYASGLSTTSGSGGGVAGVVGLAS